MGYNPNQRKDLYSRHERKIQENRKRTTGNLHYHPAKDGQQQGLQPELASVPAEGSKQHLHLYDERQPAVEAEPFCIVGDG